MSGGHFDYKQYCIKEIAEEIEGLLEKKEPHYCYSKEVIEELKKGAEIIKKAAIYAHRIDWLLSGDDGEEDFLRRLKDDLGE